MGISLKHGGLWWVRRNTPNEIWLPQNEIARFLGEEREVYSLSVLKLQPKVNSAAKPLFSSPTQAPHIL